MSTGKHCPASDRRACRTALPSTSASPAGGASRCCRWTTSGRTSPPPAPATSASLCGSPRRRVQCLRGHTLPPISFRSGASYDYSRVRPPPNHELLWRLQHRQHPAHASALPASGCAGLGSCADVGLRLDHIWINGTYSKSCTQAGRLHRRSRRETSLDW